jgi:hypothetical protein
MTPNRSRPATAAGLRHALRRALRSLEPFAGAAVAMALFGSAFLVFSAP